LLCGPVGRDGWEHLFPVPFGCTPDEASVAYDTMFPDGYDPDGTDDAVPHLADLDLETSVSHPFDTL